MSPEWPIAEDFLKNEMKPIIKYIKYNNPDGIIKDALRKYLIISCVSLIEEFLLRLFRRTIDENKIDISIFETRIRSTFDKKKTTVGEHVSAEHYFGTPEVIDSAFSKLLKSNKYFHALNMSFLETVKKQDWYNPYRFLKKIRTEHLYKNWDNFIKMFDVRNNIIHGMPKTKLSDNKTFAFCDNTLSFLEAAIWLCKIDENKYAELKNNTQALNI